MDNNPAPEHSPAPPEPKPTDVPAATDNAPSDAENGPEYAVTATADNRGLSPERPADQAGFNQPVIQWTSSEFIAHDKSASWYGAFIGGTVVVSLLVLILTKDKISTVVILIAAIALAVYAGRKPRTLDYALLQTGLAIGEKTYDYAQFRSFSLDEDGPLVSASLMPHKRFGQLIVLYFDHQEETAIVEFLSQHLPLERRKMDLTDKLLKKISF